MVRLPREGDSERARTLPADQKEHTHSFPPGLPDCRHLLAARHREYTPSLRVDISETTANHRPRPPQYQLHANGSLTMSPAPFADDGRLQTQNPCTPTTSVLTYYNEWEMWDQWEINIDTNHQAYSIRAQNYNGKVPR
mgnify:FL=1